MFTEFGHGIGNRDRYQCIAVLECVRRDAGQGVAFDTKNDCVGRSGKANGVCGLIAHQCVLDAGCIGDDAFNAPCYVARFFSVPVLAPSGGCLGCGSVNARVFREGVIIDRRNRDRNKDGFDVCSVKGAVADGSQRARQRDLGDAPAALECVVADLGNALGNDNARQLVTVFKCTVANGFKGGGQSEFLERMALTERTFADLDERFGQGDACELFAVCECVVADGDDTLGNNDGGNIIVVVECFAGNRGDLIAVQTDDDVVDAAVKSDHDRNAVAQAQVRDAVLRDDTVEIQRGIAVLVERGLCGQLGNALAQICVGHGGAVANDRAGANNAVGNVAIVIPAREQRACVCIDMLASGCDSYSLLNAHVIENDSAIRVRSDRTVVYAIPGIERIRCGEVYVDTCHVQIEDLTGHVAEQADADFLVFERGDDSHVLDGVVTTVEVSAEHPGILPLDAGQINVVDQLIVCPGVHVLQILGLGDLDNLVTLKIHDVVLLGLDRDGLGNCNTEVAVSDFCYLIIMVSTPSVLVAAQGNQCGVLVQHDDLVRGERVFGGAPIRTMVTDLDAVDIVAGLVGQSYVQADEVGGECVIDQRALSVNNANALHEQLTVDKYGGNVIVGQEIFVRLAVCGCSQAFYHEIGQTTRELVLMLDAYADLFSGGHVFNDGVGLAVDLDKFYDCAVGVLNGNINVDVFALGNGRGVTDLRTDGKEVHLGQNVDADGLLNDAFTVVQIVCIGQHDRVGSVTLQLCKESGVKGLAACNQLVSQVDAQVGDAADAVGVGLGRIDGNGVMRLVLFGHLVCRLGLGIGLDGQIVERFLHAVTVRQIVGDPCSEGVIRVGKQIAEFSCVSTEFYGIRLVAKQLDARQSTDRIGVFNGQIDRNVFLRDLVCSYVDDGNCFGNGIDGKLGRGLLQACAVVEVIGIECLKEISRTGQQALHVARVKRQFDHLAGLVAAYLQAGQRCNAVGVGECQIEGEEVLTYALVSEREDRKRLCLRVDLGLGNQLVRAVSVIEVVRIGRSDDVLSIRQQTACTDCIQGQIHGAGLVADQLQLCQLCDAVRVFYVQRKANLGLRNGGFADGNGGNCLGCSREVDDDAFGVAAVLVGRGQHVFVIGKEVGDGGGSAVQSDHAHNCMLQYQRGDGLVGGVFSPDKVVINGLGAYLDVIKEQDSSGVERLGFQYVNVGAGAVQRIVVCDDGILVQRVGGQTAKSDSVLLTERDGLHFKHLLAVINDRHNGTFALFDQREGIVHGDLEGDIVKSNIFVLDDRHGLLFGPYACAHGLVAVHTNVLDIGAVDVLDGVDGVILHALNVTDVDLEDQVFHIRAGLEHIGGVLITVERKGQNFKAVGVVDVNGNIDILVLLCVVDRLSGTLHLQRILGILQEDVGIVATGFYLVKRIVLICLVAGQIAADTTRTIRYVFGNGTGFGCVIVIDVVSQSTGHAQRKQRTLGEHTCTCRGRIADGHACVDGFLSVATQETADASATAFSARTGGESQYDCEKQCEQHGSHSRGCEFSA